MLEQTKTLEQKLVSQIKKGRKLFKKEKEMA
jgi:hypothetical protein